MLFTFLTEYYIFGLKGMSITFSSGKPTATVGEVGGFYIDTSNGKVYGKKQKDGTWPFLAYTSAYINCSIVPENQGEVHWCNIFNDIWEKIVRFFKDITPCSETLTWGYYLLIVILLLLICICCRRWYRR